MGSCGDGFSDSGAVGEVEGLLVPPATTPVSWVVRAVNSPCEVSRRGDRTMDLGLDSPLYRAAFQSPPRAQRGGGEMGEAELPANTTGAGARQSLSPS